MKKLFHGIVCAALLVLLAALPVVAEDTIFTCNQANSFNLWQPGANGQGGSVTCTVEVSAAITTNDVIQMVKVPRTVTVTDVAMVSDDIDTGSGIVLDVGYGDNVDYFIDGSTIGQAGGFARSSAVTAFPLAFTAPDTIDVLVQVPASTGVAGTLALTVWYTRSP